MTEQAWARRARHPVAAARSLVRRVAEGPGLPLGRTATERRLLRAALDDPERALVVGPVAAARQALPSARLDVVGTDPHRADVTVVSEAADRDSLPRRWPCVVVTDPAASPGRLEAAAGAGLPGAVVALVRSARSGPVEVPGTQVERTLQRGAVQVVVARVAAP